jgi:hypothetical protein
VVVETAAERPHRMRYRELVVADANSVTLYACWSPDSPNPALRRLADLPRGDGAYGAAAR